MKDFIASEKFISKNLQAYFTTDLPFEKPDSLAQEWGNKQFCQHQMLFAVQHMLEKMVIRCDVFIAESNDVYLEELRTNLRKLLCVLKYAVENDNRWKDQNIDYSELCAYVDIELLKMYPDENHIPETIPA
jgi:hypothetical protein